MAVSVSSGELNRLGELLSSATTQDSTGQPIATWSVYATPWAKIEPLGGRELLLAQQIAAEATTRVTIRYRDTVHAGDRFRYAGTTYEIVNLSDLESRHIKLEMMCKAVTV